MLFHVLSFLWNTGIFPIESVPRLVRLTIAKWSLGCYLQNRQVYFIFPKLKGNKIDILKHIFVWITLQTFVSSISWVGRPDRI